MTIDDFNLFKECVIRWGNTSQLLMAIEEMNELSVELCHQLRANKPHDVDRIIEEITDVKLMMDQIQFIFNISDGKLDIMRSKKIQRLKKLLKN
ncbi:hypothetical protein ES702_03927 [subsurface metagenome]